VLRHSIFFRRKRSRGSNSRLGSLPENWPGPARPELQAAVLIGGAFGVQQWQLSRLGSEWATLEPQVKELEDLQQQIRKYRPWFDESFAGLTILRKITEAFPAEGIVTAKSVEIHELNTVTCSGTASDNQALLRVPRSIARVEGNFQRESGEARSGPRTHTDAIHIQLSVGRRSA
jgi:hypothetical protein